jgi:hypothetical protein
MSTLTIFVSPITRLLVSSTRSVVTWLTVGNFFRRQTSFAFSFRQTNVTPLTVRSRPATLHGEPTEIDGAAASAFPPVSIHAMYATVAVKNSRCDGNWVITAEYSVLGLVEPSPSHAYPLSGTSPSIELISSSTTIDIA